MNIDFDGNFAVYDTREGRICSTFPGIPDTLFPMIQQLLCPGRGAVFIRRVQMTLIYEDIQS